MSEACVDTDNTSFGTKYLWIKIAVLPLMSDEYVLGVRSCAGGPWEIKDNCAKGRGSGPDGGTRLVCTILNKIC